MTPANTTPRTRRIDQLIDHLEMAESMFFMQNHRAVAEQVRIVIDTGIEIAGMLSMFGPQPEILKSYYKFLSTTDIIKLKFNRYAKIKMS